MDHASDYNTVKALVDRARFQGINLSEVDPDTLHKVLVDGSTGAVRRTGPPARTVQQIESDRQEARAKRDAIAADLEGRFKSMLDRYDAQYEVSRPIKKNLHTVGGMLFGEVRSSATLTMGDNRIAVLFLPNYISLTPYCGPYEVFDNERVDQTYYDPTNYIAVLNLLLGRLADREAVANSVLCHYDELVKDKASETRVAIINSDFYRRERLKAYKYFGTEVPLEDES